MRWTIRVRDALRRIHGRAAGSQFRPAPQAWAKARLLRFLGAVVKTAVGFFGRFDGANRAAIDAGRGYGYEKDAVKTRITRNQRLIACFSILCHNTYLYVATEVRA